MDLNAAFHQVPLVEEDGPITSFQTSNQKLQFVRMPFGLKGSPITWQKLINSVLDELLNKNLISYMDDILLYDITLKQHIASIKRVLDRLRKFNLKLKVNKTKFLCDEVFYLGFIINKNGVSVNPEKVACINEYKQPETVTELQRFQGCCSYFRKHVPNYAQIAKPLHNLCKMVS